MVLRPAYPVDVVVIVHSLRDVTKKSAVPVRITVSTYVQECVRIESDDAVTYTVAIPVVKPYT